MAQGNVTFLMQRPRILLFGDSLTERGFEPDGWAGSLGHYYVRRADIVNRGMGGYNTRWALQVVEQALRDGTSADGKQPPMLMTIFFGANDAARLEGPAHSARQAVPVAEYAGNLRKMVEAARAAGVQRLLLLTPPPVCNKGRKAWQAVRMGGEAARDMPLDRTLEATRQYAAAAREAAQGAGVPCLDLFTVLQQEDKWAERLLSDGLHFTPEGQRVLWSHIKQALEKEFPDIKPEDLSPQFPLWDQIPADDPASIFPSKQ